MPRFRLTPAPVQEAVLQTYCAHARFVWNLAVEQHAHWRSGRKSAPGYAEQSRQLTEARREFAWLREGSYTVQQQALRDFAHAMAGFFNRTHHKPAWRKAGRDEGFRIVGRRGQDWDVRRVSRNVGQVRIPKVGWVAFRWSRAVGLDRGVTVSAALSTGELLTVPGLSDRERLRLLCLRRRLARAKKGSNRRKRVKAAIAKLLARQTDRRKDWCEKTSTRLATGFDLMRVEDLDIKSMTRSAKGTAQNPGRNVRQKAGLNRGILAAGWGLLVRRLEEKAPGRVEKVKAAYTSQTCSGCGHVAAESRESQALFRCVACGHAVNADVNAARNIAAGRAVTARGGRSLERPVNREPQPVLLLT